MMYSSVSQYVNILIVRHDINNYPTPTHPAAYVSTPVITLGGGGGGGASRLARGAGGQGVKIVAVGGSADEANI